MSNKTATILMTATLAFAMAVPAAAHIGWTPNLACQPEQQVHDWVGAATISATALQGTSLAGGAIVFEGSIDCPAVPLLCDGDIVVDDGGTPEDPADDTVIPCGNPGLGTPTIPGTDDDFEWGIGGALLPGDHHGDCIAEVTAEVQVEVIGDDEEEEEDDEVEITIDASVTVGVDGNDDGFVDGNDNENDTMTAPTRVEGIEPEENNDDLEFTVIPVVDADAGARECVPGDDIWVFTAIAIDTDDDGSIGPDDCDGDGNPDTDPLLVIDLRILGADTDGDGLPGADTDGDGVPDSGVTNPEWGPEDLLTVNPDWCPPAVNPPTGPPSNPASQVSLVGHAR